MKRFFFVSWRYEKKNLITLLYETAKVSYSVIRFFFSYLHETKKIIFIP